MKQRIVATMSVVALGGLLVGCGNQQRTSSQAHSSTKTTQVSARQKLINALPKGIKSTDAELILVNKWHQHHELSFKKTTVDGKPINQRIEQPLTAFLAAAKRAGYPATLVSAYRSVSYQQQVWNTSISTYESQGKSAKEALKLTKEYVAVPGGSEHMTGLAADIENTQWFTNHGGQLEGKSDQAAGQKWLIEHAPDYGFVLRFTKNGVKSTGIDYESWHFRYVGKASAKFMVQHNLTLEQYVSLLKARESAHTSH